MAILCTLDPLLPENSQCSYCCICCEEENCRQRCHIVEQYDDDENKIMAYCPHAEEN